MSQHVPEDLLTAFIEGEMGDQLAIHIADHIDGCPSCATRAAGLEPLAAAFAAIEDPEVPEGLTALVLAAAVDDERTPALEIAVGGGMLVAACAMLAVFGNPVVLAARMGVWADAMQSLSRALLISLPDPMVLLPATVLLGFVGCLAIARLAWPEQRLLRFRPAGRLP